MDFAQQLGKRMRRARTERGITQSELALTAGVGANYIPRLERGEMVPSVEAAFRIARTLGVSLDSLCGRTGKRTDDDSQELIGRLQRADAAALRRLADVVEALGGRAKRPPRRAK
jgi:transcriptional regulator with XRE-family HTH domain